MPSDRERRINNRRLEIAEADGRTLLDGGKVNWARQELDRSARIDWCRRSLTVTFVDTVRARHTERRTTIISLPSPLWTCSSTDTIRAAATAVDSVRDYKSWTLGVTVETEHVKPRGK